MFRPIILCAVLFLGVVPMQPVSAGAKELLDLIRLPPGYKIEPYARVPGARSMAVVPSLGVVFVGTRSDTVFAVLDEDGDGHAEEVRAVLSGLKVANGIAWLNGWLYVAEQHRVVRFSRGPI